jgi:cell division transport system ATP-binding protein
MDRTIAENIDLALDILGLSDSVILKRRRELLELTNLTDKSDNFPVQLSGGQLQRVIIARALATQPKLLFADEPTGNLDKETGMGVIELLKDINEQGTTVILATHDTELVKGIKARQLQLEEGKLVKDSGETQSKKVESEKDQPPKKQEEKKEDKS